MEPLQTQPWSQSVSSQQGLERSQTEGTRPGLQAEMRRHISWDSNFVKILAGKSVGSQMVGCEPVTWYMPILNQEIWNEI